MLIFNFFESKNQGEIDVLFPLSFRCKYISTLSISNLTHKNHVSNHNVVLFVTETGLSSKGLCGKKKKKKNKPLTPLSLSAVAFLLPFGSSDLSKQSH